MKISSLQLTNIRGFIDSGIINFSENINIFIGENNSGKSTLLNSILLLQKNTFNVKDISLEKTAGKIKVQFTNPNNYFPKIDPFKFHSGQYETAWYLDLAITTGIEQRFFRPKTTQFIDAPHISSVEPDNLIYPYLSKRKVGNYSEVINSEKSNSVTGNFENLYAKIDRLSNPYFKPGFDEYKEACENVIGFPISCIPSANGKRAALIVENLNHIPLTSMGEGVANLLGLIVDLCIAKEKVFLIEEPENDIHPTALKALLALIEKKSQNNQFFISTHSNIVAKYLGGLDKTKLFKVTMNLPEDKPLPQSSIKEISKDKRERQQVLEELGYEFNDYDIWKGWLFLEESSAEEIIRDFLIPFFVPSLKTKLRTYSSRSVTEVSLKFKDFNNLFVFLHLEPMYKNKAWVILDSGENEKQIIEKMKEYYLKHGWDEKNFGQFLEHDFENYYPESFKQKVADVLAITDKKDRRYKKAELLVELKQWITVNKELAKKELAISAKEIISLLENIAENI